MMDSACAEYDVLRKQKQAVGTGIQQPVFCMICARPSISRRRSVYPQAM